MSTLNRIDQQMVEESLPIGTTADSNPYDYGKVKAKKTEKKVYTQAELDEAVKAEREAWIIKMLSIRDIAYEMEQDEVADEVYHFVYSLADSTFKNPNVWEKWEAIRAKGE